MNLIQQNEKVAEEISNYFAFRKKLALQMAFRSLNPKFMLRLAALQLRAAPAFLSRKQAASIIELRRKQLELLCYDHEKTNPFYRIASSDPYALPALCQHIGGSILPISTGVL